MSGSGLTREALRKYEAHVERHERRARAEQERAEKERAEKERAEKERAEQERAAENRAAGERAPGERAAKQPADASGNVNAGDNSSSPSPGSYLDYLDTASNRIVAFLRCLWKHRYRVLRLIGVLMIAILIKFILDTPIPFPGGTIGGFILVLWETMCRDPGSVPGVLAPVGNQTCLRDGPVFSVSGKVLRDIAKELDKKVVEGIELSFDETLLVEVRRADERLATVTRRIADHSYDVCQHISRLDKIISSKPSWLTTVLQSLYIRHSKETEIQNEAERFLSTLDHGMEAHKKLIKQTKDGYESIRELQMEFCRGREKILKIKTNITLEISNLTDIITARERSNVLWKYAASPFRKIDIAALKSDNTTLWEKLVAADDLRIYIAFGCSGSRISYSELHQLEADLKTNGEWKKIQEIGLYDPPLDLATIPFQRPISRTYYALKLVSHPRQPNGDFREIASKSQDVFPFELARKVIDGAFRDSCSA
ncbi:hypothetical protein FGLOB1_2595 [Fusarium globosum]|uniref:Uncharacterized protein n=1 Tax=Fusarium globosum TaxID=78864 RepID=A0A8H5YP75_9HYPO|nr:hypothetical protein FGLOB1_2595 [Fusarium globosum]